MGFLGLATSKELEQLETRVNSKIDEIDIPEEQILTLNWGEEVDALDVFAKDQKLTNVFLENGRLQGYLRGNVLHIWAEVHDDSLPVDGQGGLFIRVNRPLPFKNAGTGPLLVGSADIFNKAGFVKGTAKYDPLSGLFYVVYKDKIVGFQSGIGRSDDYPFSFHYGLWIHFRIDIP